MTGSRGKDSLFSQQRLCRKFGWHFHKAVKCSASSSTSSIGPCPSLPNLIWSNQAPSSERSPLAGIDWSGESHTSLRVRTLLQDTESEFSLWQDDDNFGCEESESARGEKDNNGFEPPGMSVESYSSRPLGNNGESSKGSGSAEKRSSAIAIAVENNDTKRKKRMMKTKTKKIAGSAEW